MTIVWMSLALVVALVLVRGLLVARARSRFAVREVPGFLSEEECAHLIEAARPRLQQSAIVSEGQGGTIDRQRKSGSAFLDQAGDPVIQAVKRRVAELTETRPEQQERLQVTHYHEGERYAPHFDALGASGMDMGEAGDRLWTVIMYLNDDFRGGSTVFPHLMRRVKAERGKAVVFRNLEADAKTHDRLSYHAGAPVLGGEKWLSNQWIRVHDRHPKGRIPKGAIRGQRKPKKRR